MKGRLQVITIILVVILFLLVSLNVSNSSPAGNEASKAGSTSSGVTGTNGSLTYIAPSLDKQSPSVSLNGTWSSMLNYTLEKINASNVPVMARQLPNFNAASSGSPVPGPVYTSAPAPMGLASYGFTNKSGTIQPYTYTTSSFKGVINISSVSEFYAGTSSPYSFSIQFNSVLTGVTIAGTAGYQYWIQNVAFYSSRTHQLTFVDNIWNFSSPNAVINNGTFHSYNGTVVPGVYYYTMGPTYTVSAPFSLTLYINSTNIDGENAVFFNYSLSNVSGSEGIISSSYDRVLFNSTTPGSTTGIPEALFEVSGSNLSGTEAIPLDAELDLSGPGGGSTADFSQINATLNMYYMDKSSGMVPIGSAYDAGSASGETSSGISAYYEGTTEYLYTGPSFISGLWNITSTGKSGFAEVTGSINPASAFVMFSTGSSFNNSSAQWAPTGSDGSFITRLMPGTYSMQVMMSYHDPTNIKTLALTSGGDESIGSINLTLNNSTGLYTPLYVSGNPDLGKLSYSGSGTASSPYIIAGYAYLESHGIRSASMLNTAFSAVNDYLFPEYSGILVTGTTDYVVFTGFSGPGNTPAFQYTVYGSLNLLTAQYLGMTPTNYLGLYFYNSSHIVLTNSTVSQAFPAAVYDGATYYNVPEVSSLTFWNVTDSLIENNLVCSQGSGVLIYNDASTDAGNYVWNNTFRNAAVISDGSFFGGSPIGLTVESSGNTVFNNLFDTTITIVSIDGLYANIYNDGSVSYHDAFNISRRSSSSSMVIDGANLTGSIIGGTYQGGNFYYNYFGDGSSAYNGSGLGLAFPGQNLFNGSINDGFDYVPLQVYTTTANVSASGLPSGQQTYFDINNAIYTIPYGSSVTLHLPNGTYQILGFILLNSEEEFVPSSYMGTQLLQSGDFYVHGPVNDISIQYGLYLNVTVSEIGLPPGTVWGFAIPAAGEGFTLNGNNESLFLEYGVVYQIFPQAALGYYTNSIITFSVSGTGMDIPIQYYPTGLPTSYSVTFLESGLPAGTLWHVYIDSQEFNSTSSTMTIINFPGGTYNYSVSKISGYQDIQGSQFTIDRSNVTVELSFMRTSGSVSPLYLILVGVAGLVAGVVISFVVLSRRH